MDQAGVSVSERDGCMTIRLEGQGGMDAARSLQQLLAVPAAQNVAIDWESADHVHAGVLQVLLSTRSSLAENGLSLAVVRDNPRVREYLQLSGLGQYFPVRPEAELSATREGDHA
jgi:anti-anti-sigma factor